MTTQRVDTALVNLEAAAATGAISQTAVANIRVWLTDRRYVGAVEQLVEHIEAQRWPQLNDLFWRAIPFGTAGRRGPMHPIGTNAINDYTIAETAQGLADYVRALDPLPAGPRVAIAYDTRHRSRQFATLCAEVMAAAGFAVYWFDDFRGTPELGFAVRAYDCACGIMISASHNPPEDNAIKIFWSGGLQIRPPHDLGIMAAVASANSIARLPFSEAERRGLVVRCQAEMDEQFQQAVLAHSSVGPRDVKILYSPLHGVGASSVLPVLRAAGFARVELYGQQATPDGDFPNVPDRIANPESPIVMEDLARAADERETDLVLASDPDADRIGCAARTGPAGAWRVLSGNQIAVLLADFILARQRAAQALGPDSFLVKTYVTSEMLRAVADRYGVRTHGEVLTGFKWIGSAIDEFGPHGLVLAAEEAHGYLIGDYARDKDAAGAALLLAELAAECRQHGETLHGRLDRLYDEVGYFAERTISHSLPGAAGMEAMQRAMSRLRAEPPQTIGGLGVGRLRDYLHDATVRPCAEGRAIEGKECDLLFFELEPAPNAVAVRPSGTEPKLKFYLFAHRPAGIGVADRCRSEVDEQLERMRADVLVAAGLSVEP